MTSMGSTLSGYRVMWIMALFDLPVLTKAERQRATKFRNLLHDEGFMMMQFSCYLRYAASKEQAETITRRIGRSVPEPGKVDVIWFTDKQYAAIQSYRGRGDAKRPGHPDQLSLF